MFNRADYLTTKEAAVLLGVHEQSIRRWSRERADPAMIEIYGGVYLVHKTEVERWRVALAGRRPMKGARPPFGKPAERVAG